MEPIGEAAKRVLEKLEAEAGKAPAVTVNGREVEGVPVGVHHTVERPSEFHLEDGTVLLGTVTAASAVRAIGKYDANGAPVYVLKMTSAIRVSRVGKGLERKE